MVGYARLDDEAIAKAWMDVCSEYNMMVFVLLIL